MHKLKKEYEGIHLYLTIWAFLTRETIVFARRHVFLARSSPLSFEETFLLLVSMQLKSYF